MQGRRGEATSGWTACTPTKSQLPRKPCPRRPRWHLTKIPPPLSAWGSLASPQNKEFTVPGTQSTLTILTMYLLNGKKKWKSRPTLCDSMEYTVSPWISPGQNTGVGSLPLLKGIFPTQVEPRSPALQADYLPTELSGKHLWKTEMQAHLINVRILITQVPLISILLEITLNFEAIRHIGLHLRSRILCCPDSEPGCRHLSPVAAQVRLRGGAESPCRLQAASLHLPGHCWVSGAQTVCSQFRVH